MRSLEPSCLQSCELGSDVARGETLTYLERRWPRSSSGIWAQWRQDRPEARDWTHPSLLLLSFLWPHYSLVKIVQCSRGKGLTMVVQMQYWNQSHRPECQPCVAVLRHLRLPLVQPSQSPYAPSSHLPFVNTSFNYFRSTDSLSETKASRYPSPGVILLHPGGQLGISFSFNWSCPSPILLFISSSIVFCVAFEISESRTYISKRLFTDASRFLR